MSQKLTKNTNYSIYGHTYFAHNSAIFWPNGLKFFVGTRDTIIYRLVKRNRGYDLNSKSSIFRPFLAGKWAWPPYRRLGVWSLKTRPKSSPTVGSIWAASYLKIMFQKFFTLDPPLKHLMNKCAPNSNGIMIPGSAKGSDLSTHVLGIKKKLKDVLLDVQRLDTPSNQGWNKSNSWFPENFFSI